MKERKKKLVKGTVNVQVCTNAALKASQIFIRGWTDHADIIARKASNHEAFGQFGNTKAYSSQQHTKQYCTQTHLAWPSLVSKRGARSLPE